MGSEMQSAAGLMGSESMVARLKRSVAERMDWERIHPELAAAWGEALREDHEWMLRRERDFLERDARVRVPDVLRDMEVPIDAVVALSRLQDSEPVKAARKFWAAPAAEARFLLLLGSIGVGKTVAAAWVLGEAIAARRQRMEVIRGNPPTAAMFVRAATFSRMSAYNADDRAWFEEMCHCTALVLDDLAAESLSPIGAAMLDDLLDRRYGARLRTVITSNLAKEAFLLRLGERAADRMRHFAVLCQSKGQSLRSRQAVKP